MPANTENGRGRSIWRRIALPISLVLNIFLIAVIGGHILHRDAYRFRSGGMLRHTLANAEASLSPSDAEAFGAVMRRDASHYTQSAADLASVREELEKQIATDPYDKDAVKHALVAWRDAWDRFTNDLGDTLAEALSKVSPEGRRKLILERR
jgi:uncharacterized membrane protein